MSACIKRTVAGPADVEENLNLVIFSQFGKWRYGMIYQELKLCNQLSEILLPGPIPAKLLFASTVQIRLS